MREEPAMDDLTRLRHAIREELGVQHGIDDREANSEWLDVLADMVTSRIDYGFDVRWNPRWVKAGESHRWEEAGEFYVECLQCRRVAVHPTADSAAAWFDAHLSNDHEQGLSWRIGDRYYGVTLASTPHSMDLELDDLGPGGGRGTVAIASKPDIGEAISLRLFSEDPLPLELLERFAMEAQRRL